MQLRSEDNRTIMSEGDIEQRVAQWSEWRDLVVNHPKTYRILRVTSNRNNYYSCELQAFDLITQEWTTIDFQRYPWYFE